ncbi:hypothetical protein PVL29_009094 [Vitis rotundifolia]|uniref:Germin-like protein n=1 Tax=Vitis rotundifolia TaxID=103349 RepID=A0AA38ZZJ2_VITRO|nr:hypothetical protein PVL29_009094 [Vitis rotundifolia]
MLHILALFSFLLVSSSHAAIQDFCVADLTAPQGPEGYTCKTPAEVTADDFVYSGLRQPGNTSSSIFNASINSASVHKFPVLNGLGVSVARADVAPGGVLPLHTHPGGTEIILVGRGAVTAGLISSDNTVYVKTVEEGDIMVFPQGLLHFLVNSGGTEALIWVSFSSPSPGLQVLNTALFGNNLDSDLLEKITLLGDDEVQRLKGIFGGSG